MGVTEGRMLMLHRMHRNVQRNLDWVLLPPNHSWIKTMIYDGTVKRS